MSIIALRRNRVSNGNVGKVILLPSEVVRKRTTIVSLVGQQATPLDFEVQQCVLASVACGLCGSIQWNFSIMSPLKWQHLPYGNSYVQKLTNLPMKMGPPPLIRTLQAFPVVSRMEKFHYACKRHRHHQSGVGGGWETIIARWRFVYRWGRESMLLAVIIIIV